MNRTCRLSGTVFDVDVEDLALLTKLSPIVSGVRFDIPVPTLCPEERLVRRLNWRNAHSLHRRTCALTGENIISAYPPDAPFTVFSQEAWWGDGWDPFAFGRDFDFSRPFFEQFRELQMQVPRLALMNRGSENSEYCSYAGRNKNCYLVNGGSFDNESCYYGEAVLRGRDCLNCSFSRDNELCYEAFIGEKLYRCAFVIDCHFCSECYFCADMQSCQNCFFCTNLRSKNNYIYNRPATKEELDALHMQMRSRKALVGLAAEFKQLYGASPHPASHQTNCEGCSGDYLTNCRNVSESFITNDIEDGRYLFRAQEGKDLMDCTFCGLGGVELFYECITTGALGQRNLFCVGAWSANDNLYCDTVMSCSNCFGCVGLKHAHYCIFNRQYSKDDYAKRAAKLIEHMQKTSEWGEFFPPGLAPWAYNESDAYEVFPRSREQVLGAGYKWSSTADDTENNAPASVPDSIDEVTDAILSAAVVCRDTGRRFRFIKQEIDLHRKLGIALPDCGPIARLRRRHSLRNPSRICDRSCCGCSAAVQSTFAPHRGDTILCDECYLKLLYSDAADA